MNIVDRTIQEMVTAFDGISCWRQLAAKLAASVDLQRCGVSWLSTLLSQLTSGGVSWLSTLLSQLTSDVAASVGLNRCDISWPPSLRCHFLLLLILLLLLKNVSGARLGESDTHPISPKTPAPQYQPIDRKKRKGKRVEEIVGIEQLRPIKKHWPCSWNPPVPHHRKRS